MMEAIFGSLVIFAAVGAVLYGLLVAHLRRHHPAMWVGLERPRIVAALSPRSSAAMGDFIWKGGHREVVDLRVQRLVLGLKSVMIGALVLLGLGIVCVFVGRVSP